ncbi:3-isopropylmalate dehydratase large subunit [bacterium]|nr:3-isopropylmalate dehydratase large subunit [Gemmatimonadota bacterium]MCH2663050.1 3-isopropylmalate dehydratase large subunit [bacterium]HCK09195.1 3-isopropylmalate dehydratase large subunit [Candidatus Latescibacterota bacterium]
MGQSLFEKVWDAHSVRTLPSGQTQLFIGLHLIHEVTSPQAFQMMRELALEVAYPNRTFATVDHIVPTDVRTRPFADEMAEQMMQAIEENTEEFDIPLFDMHNQNQGIVHVIGPELGLTQPGMTVACGDSHTSTHGAFGAIAFGIGTSQVRDVLATQCLAMDPLKVRQVRVNGLLGKGVYAKDVILNIIRQLGVKGGVGYAYEFAGAAIENLTMEERMTVCNMAIEGGARAGYINPDDKTYEYLKGRKYAPQGDAFDRAVDWWKSMASDEDAHYDDIYDLDGSSLEPTVTWGITPGQSLYVTEQVPAPADLNEEDRDVANEAYAYMGLQPGQPIAGTPIDVAFIGSCTNSRISDLREAAKVVQGHKVSSKVKPLVVPGSREILKTAEAEGLHEIFEEAGFEWRGAGCSMCLAMNPDKLQGRQVCASSSNRNFKGRQGSPTGRTLLMSPAMVAAAAIAGEVVDVRTMM